MYIKAHVIDTDEVFVTEVNTDLLPNNFRKYIGNDGAAYLYRDHSQKHSPLTIVKKDIWSRMLAHNVENLRDSDDAVPYKINTRVSKPRELGIFHFLYTYIILPLCTLIFLIACIELFFAVGENSDLYPLLILGVITTISTVLASVSLTKKAFFAHYSVKIHLVSFVGYQIFFDLLELVYEGLFPTGTFTVIVLSIMILLYYHRRKDNLNNYDCTTLGEAVKAVPYAFILVFYIMEAILYVWTISSMFDMGVGWGIFAIAVPGIPEILCWVSGGLTSSYALFHYFAIAFIGMHALTKDATL